IGDDLPSFIRAELRGIRRHLARAERDDMKDPSRGKLHQAIRHVGGRRRNFSRNRAIALSLFTVANQTIRLEERLAFFEHPGRSLVRIPKLSSGAGRFVFTGAVVKRTKAARDGSSDRALQRETIPGDGIWRICLVGGPAGHVRHVLVSTLSWRSAA